MSILDKDASSLNGADKIIVDCKMVREEEHVDYARHLISVIAKEAKDGNFGDISSVENIFAAINDRIAKIDKLLGAQINEILHNPTFQELESPWRGLEKLVGSSDPDVGTKVRIMSATKDELLDDDMKALDFDQSTLFKRVYEEEYGTFGGDPFTFFIGDYYWGKSKKDMQCLESLSHVMAAANTPFVTGTCKSLFGIDHWSELHKPVDLRNVFGTPEFVKWDFFRSKEDSKFLALTLPRVIMRSKYGSQGIEVEEFEFEEHLTGMVDEHYLWGNTAWEMGGRIVDAFQKYGWFASIRGPESGGLVENLPRHEFTAPSGDKIMKCPTEIVITERREKELSDLGFIGLCNRKGTNSAVFFGCSSLQKHPDYADPETKANAFVGTQLNYTLVACRIAHYFKVIMRDKIGSYMDRMAIENFLNLWVTKYVLTNPNATFLARSVFPLAGAQVSVQEIPGRPGCYTAICNLVPHLQFNEINISVRMVAALPEAGGGDEGAGDEGGEGGEGGDGGGEES